MLENSIVGHTAGVVYRWDTQAIDVLIFTSADTQSHLNFDIT